MEIGPQSSSDTKFVAKYRKKQSEYRAEILKEDYGVGPNRNSENRYGNYLIDGEKTGRNFITSTAFNFAKLNVKEQSIKPDLTVDEYRLFNNMLSSMPMCFNLFSDLRRILIEDEIRCRNITTNLFKELNWIESVEYIDVEFIPIPITTYTNDKSAFDVLFITKDKKGRKGLITIETKYTDSLGNNSSSNTELKDQIVEKYGLFSDEIKAVILKKGYTQLHRNYLLTYSFAKQNKCQNFVNIVISPSEDEASEDEIKRFKSGLLKNNDSIFKISLEDFCQRGIESGDNEYSEIMKKFEQRYIV